jgi:hypothetical protein
MAADLRHPACIGLQKDRMAWEIKHETSTLCQAKHHKNLDKPSILAEVS